MSLHGAADVLDIFLERELGRVHPEHHQALVLVLRGPRADVGVRAPPVDAGVGPELDEDDFPAQLRGSQRSGVDPPGRAGSDGISRSPNRPN